MNILKHGNSDIIKDYTTLFTCNRCGCEFTANSSDLTRNIADNVTAADIFIQFLDNIENPDKISDHWIYNTHCPDCGQKLSKTEAELIAEE